MRTVLLVLFLLPAVAVAQEASPYLPLSHWSEPYLEHLIAAGRMADPSPLTRPFRVEQVVRALNAVDSNTVTATEWTLVKGLRADLTRQMRGPAAHLELDAGVAASSHARRDPLRAAGPGHATFSAGVALALYFGPAVVVAHPYVDTRLKYDPDWYGKKERIIAGRNAEAYISAQFRYGEIFFGSLDRNWGPPDVQGLLLSESPYGFDHFAFSLGTNGLRLEEIATQLNSLPDSTGAIHNRYMMQHRLVIHPPGRWTIAAWDASVLGGVGRQFEPWYLNPLNVGWVTQVNMGPNVNSFLGIDVSRQARVTVFGQFMLDDIQIDRKTAFDLKPPSWGLTVGARGRVPRSSGAWRVFYTQVSNLTYRNEDPTETPIYFGLGTGRNFSDYDQLSLRLSFLALSRALVEPEVTFLRQGQGDLHLPHPPVSAYPTTPAFLAGVVEHTVRIALAGRAARGRWTLSGDGGVHLISNAGHVTGAHQTQWVGTIQLHWRTKTEGRIP